MFGNFKSCHRKEGYRIDLLVNGHDVATILGVPPGSRQSRRTTKAPSEWVTDDPFEVVLRYSVFAEVLNNLICPEEIEERHVAGLGSILVVGRVLARAIQRTLRE
jgi:hypothetical protein